MFRLLDVEYSVCASFHTVSQEADFDGDRKLRHPIEAAPRFVVCKVKDSAGVAEI